MFVEHTHFYFQVRNPQHLSTYRLPPLDPTTFNNNAMALGAMQKYGATHAVATTGNAGPSKGDEAVEVGTVCIAIATPNGVFSAQYSFGNSRERVIQKSVNKVFELLYKDIA